VNYGPLNAYLI